MKKILLVAGIVLLTCCSDKQLLPEIIPPEPSVETGLPENVPGQPSKEWYMGRTAEVGITQKVPIIQVGYKTRDRKFFFESAHFDFVTASSNVTTVFQAASVSKALFSYIVMRLVDKGVIDLDRPLYEYTGGVVEERFRDAIPGDPVASARNEAWAKLLTARIILTHGSGLPNWMLNGWPSNAKLVFTYEPDTRYIYSGEGIHYLQRVIEHITGQKLNQLADQEVFGPLGMIYSSYVWRDDYPTLHAWGYNTEMVKGSQGTSSYFTEGNAAFTLRTNVRDFSLFLEALMEGRGLTPETFKAYFTPQRQIENDSYFGLGIRVTTNLAFGYGPLWSHGGSNPGFRCHFLIWPKDQTYLVYFSNGDNGAGTALSRLFNIFFPQYPGTTGF